MVPVEGVVTFESIFKKILRENYGINHSGNNNSTINNSDLIFNIATQWLHGFGFVIQRPACYTKARITEFCRAEYAALTLVKCDITTNLCFDTFPHCPPYSELLSLLC